MVILVIVKTYPGLFVFPKNLGGKMENSRTDGMIDAHLGKTGQEVVEPEKQLDNLAQKKLVAVLIFPLISLYLTNRFSLWQCDKY